jgi:hypothetical protein
VLSVSLQAVRRSQTSSISFEVLVFPMSSVENDEWILEGF